MPELSLTRFRETQTEPSASWNLNGNYTYPIQQKDLESPKPMLPASVWNRNGVLSMIKQAPSLLYCHRIVSADPPYPPSSSQGELKCILPDSPQEWHPPPRLCSSPRRKPQSQTGSHADRPNAPAWLPSLPSVFATRKKQQCYMATAVLKWIHFAIISYYCCFFKS